jgi:hypothetical protein
MKRRLIVIALVLGLAPWLPFLGSVISGEVYAFQGPTNTQLQGQPPQVTTLPDNGRVGNVVSLIATDGSNAVGVYGCTTSTCSHTSGWACMSCNSGGFATGGDVTGSSGSLTVIRIQNQPVQSGAPASGDFFRWSGTTWNHTGIIAGDIPSLDAAKITTGTLLDSLIPATINHSTVFGGSLTGTSLISSGGGESNLELFDNAGSCGAPGSSGAYHLCSQSGLIGLYPFGGSFAAIELRSRYGVANGYTALDASAHVPTAQLGSGSANSTTCLYGDQTYKPCSTGAGSSFATVSFSATPTFDLSTATTFKITLTGNVTSSTLANVPAAPLTTQIVFIVCQDATGSRTFVWPVNLHGGMTVGPIASTCSAQQFATDGTVAWATDLGVVNQ